jgi:DNA-binding response OmpR family regulator
MDKPKILIVEDDIDLSHMLCAYFRGQDYDVRAAVWGQEALTLSREEAVSLIMLDVRLPDMDGYEVYRQLRQNRHTQDVPIIFLSERCHRVEMLHGLELGVIDYVAKPFDVQELGLRVRNAIQRASQPAMINAVTDLPDRPLLDERLSEIEVSDRHWALLVLSITGLNQLRGSRGFVAADELMRAVALLARGAVRDGGNEGDFLAHYRLEDLIIITTSEKVGRIRSLVDARINHSLLHLYGQQTDYLKVETLVITHNHGDYDTARDLTSALAALLDHPLTAEAAR